MNRRAEPDHVDHVVDQWAAERPDVDASPIRIIGRISRLSRDIDRRLKAVFNAHGLEAWEYDLLASLRRLGPPYELTAGEITEALMITSGAVTNRIDRLEARGFVERVKDEGDQRFVRVRLTAAGRKVMDETLPDHLAGEERLLAELTPADRRQLERLLRKLHDGVGSA
ncbi:MarR family winged helix-turn-helix transcriptional regulator [Desertimonas flava]|uniref:MarR family winged helix-turn-helix transcriptional regulator n=1 Tax=Desertimonas flava TaxID=2064846 RepID=UPI000E34C09C|nr:MarR family transcriptional regulator [Desertimonas flava]